MEQLFYGTVEPGETRNADYEPHGKYGDELAVYVSGDTNATDVSLSFYFWPNDERYYHVPLDDVDNANVTGGEVFRPEIGGGHRSRIGITNNAMVATRITVYVDEVE